jgi:disulfide bond formation protein DsbB
VNPRLGNAAGFLACAGLLAFALYLQHFQGQDPCPLCVFQRVAYVGLMLAFLAAAVHGPGRTGAAIYGALQTLIAAAGAAVAARHVWLQHLPRDQVPECGPGLEYMLRKYSMLGVLEKVFRGSGECAESGWKFLGLSIAEWSLAWFLLLGAFAAYFAAVAWRRKNPVTADR